MIKKLNIFLKNFSLEGYIWITALLVLAIVNTDSVHFSICPFYNLGIEFCPGCGIGRSIHHLMNFEFTKSFNTHPLGIASFIVLLYRISLLTINSMQKFKTKLFY